MKLTGNNGMQLATIMHEQGILKSDMTVEECEKKAMEANLVEVGSKEHKWLMRQNFWEEFVDGAIELGYSLAL